MKITMVKKLLSDGSPCKKCSEVLEKLEQSGNIRHIDEILVADERDQNSPGVKIAQNFNVDRAPFFVVEEDGSEPVVYTIYFKLVKDVLEKLP